jgi:type IV pilus assembly protein PilF
MNLLNSLQRVSMQLLAIASVSMASLSLLGCQSTVETTRYPSGAPSGSGTSSTSSQNSQSSSSSGSARGGESDITRRAKIRTDLAANYYQERNYAVALEELRQAVLADASYAPAHGMAGLVYMALGDSAKADENFRRALGLAPTDSDLNNNYGWFLCQSGRVPDAINHFNVALKDPLYSTPARPLHNAGICSLRIGDERAAESYFLRSFQLDASNPVAMYQLADLYFKRNDMVRAKFYSERLMNNYEPSAEVLWQAYRIEKRANNNSGAESIATQLRRRFPGSNEVQLMIQGRHD